MKSFQRERERDERETRERDERETRERRERDERENMRRLLSTVSRRAADSAVMVVSLFLDSIEHPEETIECLDRKSVV